MKTAFAFALCLITATSACVDDERPISTSYDQATQQATVSIGTDVYVIDVTNLPKPPPGEEPSSELRCWWGDYSECGWEWEPESGGTVCCGWW